MLWGGREGYDTLLNTDLKREREQLARFLHMVVEHKHKIGFKGALLIEPKPQEPTKHQYDYDVATVHGFLLQYGLAERDSREHRGQSRDARRSLVSSRDRDGVSRSASSAASTRIAAIRKTAGTRISSRTASKN